MRDLFERVRPAGVIHLAAKAGVRPSIADPCGYSRVNVFGTSILLDAAHRVGCKRFVMASSSSVYGNQRKVPFSETDDVSAPISPYAATKRACELIAHTHHHLTGMPTGCLRFFTVYGPRQRPDLAIMGFMKSIRDGKPITMFGDGSSSRDYTFVGDVVSGILSAHDRIHERGYRIWNLGNSTPVTLRDMIETIAKTVGNPANIVSGPDQPGDVERTFADLSRARAELGYSPMISFAQGVAAQWAWLSESPRRMHA
jgi:UDP-glucuronate 4-epimerase